MSQVVWIEESDLPVTCISEPRRRLHVATEAASVLTVAPFSFWLATRKELPSWARASAAVLGVAVLVVDGGLLLTWRRQNRVRSLPA